MTNELTDVRCSCGDEYPADSYDAGFIAGSGMCQNCDAALPPKDICTCPSGDSSLRYPCPAHPALVEQTGGDERAAFFKHLIGRHPAHETEIVRVVEHNHAAWKAWQARAALAQPSPVRSSLLINGYQLRAALEFIAPDGTAKQLESEARIEWRQQDADFLEAGLYAWCAEYPEEGCVLLDDEPTTAQPSPAPAEQAEAERPEVVAWQYRVTAGPQTGWSLWHPGKGEEFERSYTVERRPLMTVAQHDRIVGELRAVIAQLRQHKNDYMDSGQETYRALQNEIREREAEIARLDGLVSGRTAERDAALARVAELKTMADNYCALLMDANAKLAELEKQEPINLQHMAVAADGELRWMTGRKIDNCELYAMPDFGQAPKLYAAPVAQAQSEETPGEILAAKLIETWVTEHGKPAPWSTAVEITAVATNMPNDERDRLLALDDDVDAQAQHSVPEGFRELLEMLVVSDLRKLRYAGAWRREVHDRASSILALLAAAPGMEVV
ncbi:hypothetical protein ISD41_26825 [Pseudomonas aeruginosa]|nr:hypothetical protein [Pseudomonas aeruginosa]